MLISLSSEPPSSIPLELSPVELNLRHITKRRFCQARPFVYFLVSTWVVYKEVANKKSLHKSWGMFSLKWTEVSG